MSIRLAIYLTYIIIVSVFSLYSVAIEQLFRSTSDEILPIAWLDQYSLCEHFRTPASTCSRATTSREFCFELVLNALTLRSQRSAGCLGELFLRGFCADLLEPKQKEKLRSISGRSASLWLRAAASSPSRSSQTPSSDPEECGSR